MSRVQGVNITVSGSVSADLTFTVARFYPPAITQATSAVEEEEEQKDSSSLSAAADSDSMTLHRQRPVPPSAGSSGALQLVLTSWS